MLFRSNVPDSFRQLAPLFREIWVPSEFTHRSFARAGINSYVVPHVVEPPQGERNRNFCGLPEESTVFLYIFDGLSNFERKNPLGLVRAYRNAFPENTGRTSLVIKARNLGPVEMEEITSIRAERRDIRILTADMTPTELQILMASADCYVSLHRSEGFGLTMAEAMYQGIPVDRKSTRLNSSHRT